MRICVFLLLLGSYQAAMTQVRNKTCQLALNTILSDKTPVINITEVAANKNNYVFLDAREAEEYNVSHIPHARLVGFKRFDVSQISDL